MGEEDVIFSSESRVESLTSELSSPTTSNQGYDQLAVDMLSLVMGRYPTSRRAVPSALVVLIVQSDARLWCGLPLSVPTIPYFALSANSYMVVLTT